MEMNNPNSSVNPVESPTQPVQHPVNNQKSNFLTIVGVLALLVVVGGAYYLGTQKNNSSYQTINIETTPTNQPFPTQSTDPTTNTQKTERITLQDGYYFDVIIPQDYSLKAGIGDYANYVVDTDGKELIGFQKSWGGGELSATNPIIIDGVPLVIMYKKEIGCPADIFSEKANNPQRMSFGIMTWCKDEKEIQLPVYKQVIDSIVFGQELKEVLLGNKAAPSIQ